MTSFLFWNLNKKPLAQLVANISRSRSIDIVLLVECTIAPDTMVQALNTGSEGGYRHIPGIGCKKVEVYSRLASDNLSPALESERLTVRRLNRPGHPETLLAVNHFPSKLHWSDVSQIFECVQLANRIREAEVQAGHSRTILVGDFNMNPFEPGMVSANGLHAVMSKQIARRIERTVQARSYPFFYNPMWSLLGDGSSGPPGTFYYNSAEHVAYFWNMFDQVLLRPALLEQFSQDGLEILTSDGTIPLLTEAGVPRTDTASDHLPLTFTLKD